MLDGDRSDLATDCDGVLPERTLVDCEEDLERVQPVAERPGARDGDGRRRVLVARSSQENDEPDDDREAAEADADRPEGHPADEVEQGPGGQVADGGAGEQGDERPDGEGGRRVEEQPVAGEARVLDRRGQLDGLRDRLPRRRSPSGDL